MKSILTWLFVILVIIGSYYWYQSRHEVGNLSTTSTSTSATSSNVITYFCNEGQIRAVFEQNTVALTLSDMRTLTLPQTVSGSGIRYEGSGFVFSGKGSWANLMQNTTSVYSNCLAGTLDVSPGGMSIFTDRAKTFTFKYPSKFILGSGEQGYTQSWRVNATTTGLVLAQVIIPKSFQVGTNFSEAKFMVGVSSDPTAIVMCTTNTNGEKSLGNVTINDQVFAKVAMEDAGAGNFYDTISYRTLRDGDCYNVEYTIHSTNLGNYDPSQGVKQFDKTAVENDLENIVRSFVFLVQSN